MNDLLKQFLATTYTKNQALRRMRLMKELLDLLLFQNEMSDDFVNTFNKFKGKYSPYFAGQDGLENDVRFIASLGETFFKNFSSANINETISSFENGISQTKQVTVNIPFEITEEEVNRMGLWFKKNLGQEALFEINYDPELIGGCSISFNGILKNYSLKARIEENKQKVLEELSSYK